MAKNWVFMRGLARHSVHWGDFAERIQKILPGDHFEFLDASGNGQQVSEKSFLKISDYVDDLRRRCGFVSRGKKVNIVAISMGGMMAVDWAQRFPHEVESVVCINTSDGGSAPFWKRLRPISYGPLLKIVASGSKPLQREQLSLDLICNILPNKKQMVERFSKAAVTGRGNFFRQLWAASQFRFPKTKPPIPVLLLASEGDRLCSVDCTKRLAALWNVPAQIHPSAGHDLPLDAPQWLGEQISQFSLHSGQIKK